MKILNKAWFDPWGTPAVSSYAQQNDKNELAAVQGYEEWQRWKTSVFKGILTTLKTLLAEYRVTMLQSNYAQLSQVFWAFVPATHPEEKQKLK